MIDSAFYMKMMKQLEAAFGYTIPEARLKIYHQKLNKHFNDGQLENAVDVLIMNCSRFPTISDFMEVAKTHRPLL